MTILIIEGQEHDLTRALRQASIGDLLDLKRATAGKGSTGLSVAKIARALDELGDAMRALPKDATFDDVDRAILDYFDDVDHLESYGGMVFLCKRKAGEDATYADALTVNLSDVKFKAAEDEPEDEGDPKDPSTPAEGSPAEVA